MSRDESAPDAGSWSSGYDVALTQRRSPVRIRPSPSDPRGSTNSVPAVTSLHLPRSGEDSIPTDTSPHTLGPQFGPSPPSVLEDATEDNF